MFSATRTAGVAAATVLLGTALAGCGSGGGDDTKDGAVGGRPSGTRSGDTSPSAARSGLNGLWSTGKGSGAAVLSISRDTATLLSGRGSCTGLVGLAADPPTLKLSCADGATGRTSGTVRASSDSSLTIAWSGGDTETYTRAGGSLDPGALPSDLPSGFPTSLPSGLPDLPGGSGDPADGLPGL